MKDANNVVVT